MEMKEIQYNKCCNACGSEYIVVEIESLTQEADANLPMYRIKLRCNKCNKMVEIMDIYRDKVEVTVNQDVQDIFDATDEEELKAELAEAKAEVKIVKEQYDQLEAELDAQYIKANTYKSLLMDIYKLSNKGGAKNA